MFEITGNDVKELSDGDLRTLVATLAAAELTAQGLPRSAVVAGGHQDASDGGIDVRVDCPSDIEKPDFVPKRHTGFQVKKSDLGAAKVKAEMRPKGRIRPAIADLARRAGAYIIVSAQGSVTDSELGKRRDAMRNAVADLPTASGLTVDFYDRERLANWTNLYPGAAVWIRSRLGRSLTGWSSVHDWSAPGTEKPPTLLNDGNACVLDESSRPPTRLTTPAAIGRLRSLLRTPKACVRLIGLSGVGKTRLVQALFEQEIGEYPLDAALSVYTDYSTETTPTARDMARQLIATQRRAILIVDNCNPKTHAELAQLCSAKGSTVSLITVEYDVKGDEPEETDVFRLESASPDLVTEWLRREFPHLSILDTRRIAEFSDGNFKLSKAIAGSLRKGETLGSVKDRNLFDRIFVQNNDRSDELVQAAEDLSLVYSIDVSDISTEGELASIGKFRGVAPETLYANLDEMRSRGVVQARGRFRAILPQAIANPLAGRALSRIHPNRLDDVCREMPTRLFTSFTRRLGYLHDSAEARSVAERWLSGLGPKGDLFALGDSGIELMRNLAPLAPETVLARIESARENGGEPSLKHHHTLMQMVRAIAYDPALFDRAIRLLTRFAPSVSPEEADERAFAPFSQFFHLHFPGTMATPEQRRALIREMACSEKADERRCAQMALPALLNWHNTTFTPITDFGARPRTWGWWPPNRNALWEWFEEGIKLVLDVATEERARQLLAQAFWDVWLDSGCRSILQAAAAQFSRNRPWIEGWVSARTALRKNAANMSPEDRADLEQAVREMAPTDLLNRARAAVIHRRPDGANFDLSTPADEPIDDRTAYERAFALAKDIGCELATDPASRAAFFPECVSGQPMRAFDCGRGLAQAAPDRYAIWQELAAAYTAVPRQKRNHGILCGFLAEAHQHDRGASERMLEEVLTDAELRQILPDLQCRVGLDTRGIDRLRRAIKLGGLEAPAFQALAYSSKEVSPEDLATLLNDLIELPYGIHVAIQVLHGYLACREKHKLSVSSSTLLVTARRLLSTIEPSRQHHYRDYDTQIVIDYCLAGDDGRDAARQMCANVRKALDEHYVSTMDFQYTLSGLFAVHPDIALDAFLLPEPQWHIQDESHHRRSPLEEVDRADLIGWANADPRHRYPLLAGCLRLFSYHHADVESMKNPALTELFFELLERSPDRKAFLRVIYKRLRPAGWSNSRSEIMIQRRNVLSQLADHLDPDVRQAVREMLNDLDRWIAGEKQMEGQLEESFE